MSITALRIVEPTKNSHTLHGPNRIWAETNCYVDLLIELLSGLGYDPVLATGFSLGIEFEGDQWSFIKYPIEDLRVAYGVDVSELALWRSTQEHLVEQLSLGRVVIIEVDSFHLPDTVATSYRREHVKSSIAVTGIDTQQRILGYFHGAGHFTAESNDYDGLLRLNDPLRFTGDVLAPYAEVVKADRGFVLDVPDSKAAARLLATQHLTRRRSAEVCAAQFQKRLVADASNLLRDLPSFHAYAFATVRQLGAASELAGDLFGLFDEPSTAEQFVAASQACKSLQFKLARVAAGRSIDLESAVRETTESWLDAMAGAVHVLGVST
jgi:hypothetical protein